MKLQPLFIALALVAGASFAQTPAGAKGPADASATPAAAINPAGAVNPSPSNVGKSDKKAMHKTSAQHGKKHHGDEHARAHHEQHTAKAGHHEHHASAQHHEQHYAGAHHGTRSMGAGPSVDLNSSSRERRMDQAYADWSAKQR